ncbi:MAG TPA: hypothetical protein VFG74_05160 [Miltoncostaeaceae bacterium]|jgi:hypothetical protein|nr:hypothetical protein [Miltoncostaeaceae bacterium]
MAEPTGAHSVQHDEPARRDVETREETVARVAGGEEAVGAERGGSPDPSTRRGLNRALWKTVAVYAGIGFVVGAVLGLILSMAPGPFETDSVGGAIGYMIGLGLAIALVVTLLASLFLLEREDGRVQREEVGRRR